MSYQSYVQTFVTNSPALLAQGQTVDNLGVGQIGILDAKTYTAVSNPTYAKNKGLIAVWGTPDNDLGNWQGVPNENEYSKIIKGKNITKFRAKKASRGQTGLYTLGWSGDVSDTDTLYAKYGQYKNLYIKLSGTIIDRLYTKQGLVKQIVTVPSCVDDCIDTCSVEEDKIKLAKYISEQINADKDLSKFIKTSTLISEVDPVTEGTCYKFVVSACDTGDDRALGVVQAQYPTLKIERLDYVGAISTYSAVSSVNTLPSPLSVPRTVIADCPTCTLGTLVESANVYTVQVAVDETIEVDDPILSVTLLNSENGRSTYKVVVDGDIEDAELPDNADVALIGETRDICVVAPTTIAWVANGTLKNRQRNYRIVLADSVCGVNRLADLQEAYPSLVISIVNPAGDCVHTYEAAVTSECYEVGCSVQDIVYKAPSPFEGAIWVPVDDSQAASDTVKTGVLFETQFFYRPTNDYTLDYFPYENDTIHVEVSEFDPNYNAEPCQPQWVFKKIRGVKYPQGFGPQVRELEIKSKRYDSRHRSFDPIVREVQGYSLQADPTKYYDQYTLEFSTKWKSAGGWAEDYTQTFHLQFFVPEGTGGQLENVFSSYMLSTGIDEDSIAI